MRIIRSSVDWLVLALCMAAALAVVFTGIEALNSTAWVKQSSGHAAVGVLATIAAVATVKCGFLVGAGLCCQRRGRRLAAR